MNKKSIFLAIAIFAQFAVIIYTTISSSWIINRGEVLKFRLEGYDPYDMFRGNYIRIKFRDDKIENAYPVNGEGYVGFETTYEGYAVPVRVVDSPESGTIKAQLSYDEDRREINIFYPFDRVWKNQEECEELDREINEALREGRAVCALVAVKDGEGRIVDLEIGEREWEEDEDLDYEEEEVDSEIDEIEE